MVELENKVIPTLGDKVSLWHRYVDDTFTFIKKNEIENVKGILNNFHKDIKFTHEIEENNAISFLDVKIRKRSNGTFVTEVHRKKTDTNLYLNWKSFSPVSWKIGTLKGLFRRAHLICSEPTGLNKEINHLKHVFTKINGYPSRIVQNTLKKVSSAMEREKRQEHVSFGNVNPLSTSSNQNSKNEEVFPYLCLPYKGKEGESIVNRLRTRICRLLPKKVKPRCTFKGKKLGSFFTLKDPIKEGHQSNLVYGFSSGANPNRLQYIGETNVRFETRCHEHSSTDKQSSIYKYTSQNDYTIAQGDFSILESGYNRVYDRKVAEAIYIKENNPPLNLQTRSYELKLFN